jgi:hypothetical protein
MRDVNQIPFFHSNYSRISLSVFFTKNCPARG